MPRILVFSGSTRPGSFNRRLAGIAARDLRQMGAEVTEISLADYPLPFVDWDARLNPAQNAVRLNAELQAHDGLFIACPEYNSGYTPLLKNALDWASLCAGGKPVLAGKIVALGSASPGALGGYRSLTQFRSVAELGYGAIVVPEMVSVAFASQALAEEGILANEGAGRMLAAALGRLVAELRLRA